MESNRGALDAKELGFFERKAIQMAKAPEGDFRDWDEIQAFADEIADSVEKGLGSQRIGRRGCLRPTVDSDRP